MAGQHEREFINSGSSRHTYKPAPSQDTLDLFMRCCMASGDYTGSYEDYVDKMLWVDVSMFAYNRRLGSKEYMSGYLQARSWMMGCLESAPACQKIWI